MEKLFVNLTSLSSGIAYLIVFGILVACGLGFPLPEDIPLVASGYLIWDGTMAWAPALAVTLGGVAAGDTILFFIGRRLGLRMLEPGPNRKPLFPPDKIRRTRAYFRKYGDKIVFFARFVAGFRAVAFFMAGAMKMSYTKFIGLDMLAALLSVPIWLGLGYGLGHYFGDDIQAILVKLKDVKNIVMAITAVAVVAILARVLMKYRQAKLAKRKAAARRSVAKPG